MLSYVDYFVIEMFLSAVWALILMAHIHCRGSTDDSIQDSRFYSLHTIVQNITSSEM